MGTIALAVLFIVGYLILLFIKFFKNENKDEN